MSKNRQRYAHYEADCAECYKFIAQDEPIWFSEGNKYCTTCASQRGIICPECNGSKNAQFAVCYECKREGITKPTKASLI